MNAIEIKNLTKDYGDHRGVFNLSLNVAANQVFGFLGPNGAGKTTTIRNLLGFIKPDQGQCLINGLDCWSQTSAIHNQLSYLPGEITFIDDMKGLEFIRFIAEINQIPSMDKAYELLKYFELDPKGSIKKMSKGMKQKVALVCAFMQDRQVIILDEPSSGLDPLMQQKFIELVLAEKQRGKTIFMSSHIFEEVEKCCDHTAIIKDGCLVAVEEIAALKNSRRKIYDIEMASAAQALAFSKDYPDIEKIADKLVSVVIVGSTAPLIKALGRYEVTALDVRTQSLEELFMHFYGGKD